MTPTEGCRERSGYIDLEAPNHPSSSSPQTFITSFIPALSFDAIPCPCLRVVHKLGIHSIVRRSFLCEMLSRTFVSCDAARLFLEGGSRISRSPTTTQLYWRVVVRLALVSIMLSGIQLSVSTIRRIGLGSVSAEHVV